jgi:hypothetical protein
LEDLQGGLLACEYTGVSCQTEVCEIAGKNAVERACLRRKAGRQHIVRGLRCGRHGRAGGIGDGGRIGLEAALERLDGVVHRYVYHCQVQDCGRSWTWRHGSSECLHRNRIPVNDDIRADRTCPT